ncbi:NAD-dependent dehydratase [Phaeocystidibacter marisrubri]|uniref:NAD-dependent epimerase/dehydratase family protein n=2 Tax=Phaeocystidibacter marisrubri TaxID=1577780 RepID=A0A6L3ZJT1_9FLAO|nr:NAD-dependent epimerase/dehydratase family protein [Phaeocystidibacter marisrubri]GGH75585.1 NAD-dependent dehydratase [Phaeocystidibacter marisrubri]
MIMESQLHTVLGARGASGRAVLNELHARNLPTRAVTKSSSIPNVETTHADLLSASSTLEAVRGSSHVYLCIGLPYDIKVWSAEWEIIMSNVIEACATIRAVVIFLDNIYMYAPPLPLNFSEETPQNPSSKKGAIRKRTATLLTSAIESGKVQGVIGRSADFYGPGTTNSMLYVSFLQNMLAGKRPIALSNTSIPHTWANVNDNARALVDIAIHEDCHGEVWHLPVGEPITYRQVLDVFNRQLGTHYSLSQVPKFALSLLSFFSTPIREVAEMRYQFDQPYVMSWEKFHKRFPAFQTTSTERGISEMIASFQSL